MPYWECQKCNRTWHSDHHESCPRCDRKLPASQNRLIICAPGEVVCPVCGGTGIEPLVATTIIKQCYNCNGHGKV